MRITRVHIDRFAGWADTTLDLPSADIQLFYGPNETGKSTLLRFLRGVLYGFSQDDQFVAGVKERRTICSGYLRVTHGGQDLMVRRESAATGGDEVWLADADGRSLPDTALPDLLGGVSAETFKNVFAIGLAELQRISTLSTGELAGHVYQISLGPFGRRLVEAHNEARRRRNLLLDDDRLDGSIPSLARQIGQIDEQIATCEQDFQRHSSVHKELRRIESELQDQRRRRRGLENQLRGHEFMDRISGPWRRQQEIQEELDQLPQVPVIPDGGLERLDELDWEIEELTNRKRSLRGERRRLANTAAGLRTDPRFAEHGAPVRALLQRRARYSELQSRLPELRADVEQARTLVEEALAGLGEEWDWQRVESIDESPAAAIGLIRRGRRYRELLARRAREVRRYQRVASRQQQQQITLAQQLKPFNAAEVAEARELCREHLTLLQTIADEENRAGALEQKRDELAGELAALAELRPLPPYFFAVLIVFGVMGLALLIAGVISVTAGETGHLPWLTGLILALLGGVCGGVTWTIKRHFDPGTHRDNVLRDRLQRVTAELAELQDEIATNHIAASARDLIEPNADRGNNAETAERIESARQQLLEIDGMARDEESIRNRRAFLSRFRERIRQTQRAVSAARSEWCRALRETGLDESVRTDLPLDQWRGAAEAKRLLHQYRSLSDELERAQQDAHGIRDAVLRLSVQIDGDDHASEEIDAVLADWEQRLSRRDALRQQRSELRREARRKRRAEEQAADQVSGLKRQRFEHLAAAGAADREQFQLRVQAFSRRRELETELRSLNEELREAALAEPELAVVEEDLKAFEPAANREAIDTIRRELANLSRDLEANREQLGCLRQELNQLESDRRLAGLRFDRAQLRHQLVEELEAVCAVDLVAAALDHTRTRLENTHQPKTLATAGDYLARLTRGRYQRVWTRLGERQLFVDEQGCGAMSVERLSAGTREQLFLAIRLALVDCLREQGIQLPVVLDDVLVNFDDDRTHAAIDTLRDVAASGQQILMFTCHQHLADRIADDGVPTIVLPPRAAASAHRRVG